MFVLSWLIASASSGLPAAQAPAAWVGTWKLNMAQSVSLPYRRGTRSIAMTEGGGIRIVDDLVRSRGGVLHLEWAGKFDGLDYPVQGVDVVLTNAYRRIDDRTCELVQKVDGTVVATVRLTVSSDGRVLTTVSTGSTGTATTVYDRQ